MLGGIRLDGNHWRDTHLMLTAWNAEAVPFLTSFHIGEEVFSLNTLYSGLPCSTGNKLLCAQRTLWHMNKIKL